MTRRLLVTGGAGFIGSHFVLDHVKKFPEDTIVVLDKLTYAGDQKLLDPVKDSILFIKGDIADQKLVSELVEKHEIDTIVNFAAESHVDNSISDATPFLHTNVIGVQSLIEVLKGNPAVRMLHISTDEVYGDIGDDDPPRKTGDALHPSSPYAASKASSEMLLVAAIRTFGIRCCISRCTNNYGPHQVQEKFIPTVIRSALADQPVPLYGNGKNKRDWLYVGDHCNALEMILSAETFEGQIFNVGIDREFENLTVATMILDILGKPHSLINFVKDRLGHDWRYAVDSSAIRALGWKPSVTFEEGLKKTVEWYTSMIN